MMLDRTARRRRMLFDWWRKQGYLLREDFQGGVVNTWSGWSLGHPGDGETPTTSPNFAFVPAPGGRQESVLKVTLEEGDYTTSEDQNAESPTNPALVGKDRAELWWDPTAAEIPHGSVMWYGYSLFIPTDFDYVSDDANSRFQIMGQWHDAHLEQGYEPPVQIAYRQTVGGVSSLRLRYGAPDDPVNPLAYQTGNVNVNRGEWIDLNFEFKWSPNSDGYIRAYLNNVFLVQFNGKNVYSEQGATPNQWRMGGYGGFGQTTTRVFYIGRVRCGRGKFTIAS